MARFVTSIATPLSRERAFDAIADISRFAEWDPGIERVERVAGDGRGVGSAWDLTVRTVGTTVMRYEMTAWERPRSFVLTARTRLLRSVDTVRVEAAGTGSVVTYDARLSLAGPLRLMDPLLGVALRRIGERAVPGLRRMLGGIEARR
ncbi:MAG: SRPBCC family protein [Deltaproteobacteria bacterium]|nr:SRPBCC family protein [Deltaproteobacteria bacterium]